MIFQIFASIILALVAVYAYSQLRLAPLVSVLVILVIGCGEYFVLLPDHAIAVAHFIGIGRGSDLIFYIWILLSLVVSLNLYLRLRLTNEMFASLVREIALNEAARRESSVPAPVPLGPM